ncbi:MAG: hypothetical protein QG635_1591, partial [Bacteroidota bacterium]|nr:hypothetical protein [Bacteroidota bacterium]
EKGGNTIQQSFEKGGNTIQQSLAKGEYSIILASDPKDNSLADDLINQSPYPLHRFYSYNIDEVISLVKRAYLLITPDTSLVHIAAAFNIPMLALYSGLDNFFAKFAPTNDICEIVRAAPGDHGIKSIKPRDVTDALVRILKRIEK